MKLFGKTIHSKYDKKDKLYKFSTYSEKTGFTRWIELSFHNTWLEFNYKPYGYDNPYKVINISFWFFSLYVSLPFFKDKKHPYGEETNCIESTQYGFSFWSDDMNKFFAESVHLYWGKKRKIYDLPWHYEGIYRIYPHKDSDKYEFFYGYRNKRDEYIKKHLSWMTEDKQFSRYDKDGNYLSDEDTLQQMNYESFDFTHTCRTGLVQHTKAFAYVLKTIIRPKMFRWTRLFEKTITAAEILFETPVGDPDTWKGPTHSIYTPFKPGEKTLEDVVRREEKTLRTH